MQNLKPLLAKRADVPRIIAVNRNKIINVLFMYFSFKNSILLYYRFFVFKSIAILIKFYKSMSYFSEIHLLALKFI